MKLYDLSKSYQLFERSERVIPNGIQGPRTPRFAAFGSYPAFFVRNRGARAWDVDGNEYIDFMCSFGAVVLGYQDPAVEKAVAAQAALCNSVSIPSPVMVELAERLIGLIPQADWVIYGKNGSDVTTYATQLARVATGRSEIITAKNAYHGFHAWCSHHAQGFPPEYQAHVLEVEYNDLAALEQLVAEYRGRIAGIMLCPIRHDAMRDLEIPKPEYFAGVRKICDREGMVFMLDDIRCGFRMHLQGSAMAVGADPDVVCFGKAMGNGHPIAIAAGKQSLREPANKIYFSGTHFLAAGPMAASLACLHELEARDAIAHMNAIGAMLKAGMEERAKAEGLSLRYSGPPAIPYMLFGDDPGLANIRYFCGEAARRGIYIHPHHNWFLSAAHTEADIKQTLDVAEECFKLTRQKFAG